MNWKNKVTSFSILHNKIDVYTLLKFGENQLKSFFTSIPSWLYCAYFINMIDPIYIQPKYGRNPLCSTHIYDVQSFSISLFSKMQTKCPHQLRAVPRQQRIGYYIIKMRFRWCAHVLRIQSMMPFSMASLCVQKFTENNLHHEKEGKKRCWGRRKEMIAAICKLIYIGTLWKE